MATVFDVFLSHNSEDKPAVRELAEALRARGLKVWLDEEQLVPGRPWQEALEEVIEAARSAAVLVGKYYGGPTWESNDGSKVTGKQVAVAPGMAGSIPLQLVKADPAMGMGKMQGVSHIQRLNTQGGVAPAMACGMGNKGARQQVAYQADYVFYAR